jgi:hypothetical protein
MAITVGQTTAVTNTGVTSDAVTKPTGLEVGDVLVARVVNEDVVTTPPTGFTSVIATLGGTIKSEIFFKVADAGDVAASNFTFSYGGSTNSFIHLTRLIGARTVSTVSDSDGQGNINSATITSPGITPTVANSLIMFFAVVDDTNTGTIDSYTTATSPPVFTEATDGATTWIAISMAHGLRVQTTNTGNGTASFSAGTKNNIGQLIAISPRQEFTASDATTVTDTTSIIRALLFVVSDVVTLAESVAARVSLVFTNAVKNATSWINRSKS